MSGGRRSLGKAGGWSLEAGVRAKWMGCRLQELECWIPRC